MILYYLSTKSILNYRHIFSIEGGYSHLHAYSLKNRTSDRTGEAFGSWFTGWTAGSNRFDVGFLVVK
jgi:hypothetical protein